MERQELFANLTKILGTCFLLTAGLLGLWFVGYLVAGDVAFEIHCKWFDLDRHDFDVLNYYGMALLKMIAVVFFLIPFVALKIAGRTGPPPPAREH